MGKVTIRDLRNHGGDVIERVTRGEEIVVTRAGRPVAELRPVSHAPLSAQVLVERWRRLPVVDPQALRHDVDSIMTAEL